MNQITGTTMSVYIAFFKQSFKERFTYKMNSYILLFSTLIKLLILVSVWSALLKNNIVVKGINLQNMISYVIIATLIESLTGSNMGNRMAEKVNDGSIAVDFIRPVNFKFYLFAEDLGDNCFRLLFSALPACIFVAIFFGFTPPDQAAMLLLFLVSLANGLILIYYINYVLGLLAFWLKNAAYVNWLLRGFFSLFAGGIVPLWFYPDLLYRISKFLPFRLVMFDPVSIYLEKISYSDSLKVILSQIAWIFVLMILEKYVWKKAQAKITIHGG